MYYTADKTMSILDLLIQVYPECSKTTLRSWLKEGRITVDGDIVKISTHEVSAGQKMIVGLKPHLIRNRLRVIYEDKDLIAIEKPEGLLSVATAFEKGETAHAILKEKFRPAQVYVVHRLDQDTSGVMLFALTEQALTKLKETFKKHSIERKYCAIIEGRPPKQSGSWESYLYEDANYVVHATKDPEKGRLAITHFKVANTSPRHSRLELTLETGRKNQIRVHCADAGFPVLGDKKYGEAPNPLKRLALHAFLLALDHPITGKPLRFIAPVPASFDRLVQP